MYVEKLFESVVLHNFCLLSSMLPDHNWKKPNQIVEKEAP